MQAEYVMKVQVIKSRKQPPRFYMNIPLPLAAALDLRGRGPSCELTGSPLGLSVRILF